MRDVVKRTKLTENCSKKTIKKYVDEVIQETGGFVPAKVLTPGINDAKQVIREKMELFGSLGKAELYR